MKETSEEKSANMNKKESRGHQTMFPMVMVLVVVMAILAYGSFGPQGTVVSGDTNIEPITTLNNGIVIDHVEPANVSKITIHTENGTKIHSEKLHPEGSITTTTPPNGIVGTYTVNTTYENGTTTTTHIKYEKQ